MTSSRHDKQYDNCRPKKRFGRAAAEKKAFWFGMSAYRCPVCRTWRLTTKTTPPPSGRGG